MTNTLRINHENRQIIMDRTFAKNASDTRSAEYQHLQKVKQDYPTFEVIRKQIRKKQGKESYKGLTYEFMRDYISTHEPEDTVNDMLAAFDEMLLISRCHSIRYPRIKEWFLKRYPHIETFNLNENDDSISA
ncbi:MAG: hypothetical protein IKM61_03705 [Eubacteriaceae bacterium]|nr:hypothetical protein [Eubacteriaceae bacterium]